MPECARDLTSQRQLPVLGGGLQHEAGLIPSADSEAPMARSKECLTTLEANFLEIGVIDVVLTMGSISTIRVCASANTCASARLKSSSLLRTLSSKVEWYATKVASLLR